VIDPAFHQIHLPGPVEEAGFAYGRACSELLHGVTGVR
jgi:hypothetical protein